MMSQKTSALIVLFWSLLAASPSYSATWLDNSKLLRLTVSSEEGASVYGFVFTGDLPTDSCDSAYVNEGVLKAVILTPEGEPSVVAQHIYSTALAADTQYRSVDLLIDQTLCEPGYGFILEGIRIFSPDL